MHLAVLLVFLYRSVIAHIALLKDKITLFIILFQVEAKKSKEIEKKFYLYNIHVRFLHPNFSYASVLCLLKSNKSQVSLKYHT